MSERVYRVVMFCNVANETQWEGTVNDETCPYPFRDTVAQADRAGYAVGTRWPVGTLHYAERVS